MILKYKAFLVAISVAIALTVVSCKKDKDDSSTTSGGGNDVNTVYRYLDRDQSDRQLPDDALRMQRAIGRDLWYDSRVDPEREHDHRHHRLSWRR